MTLDRVTITGADDSIDPRALSDLSYEFPFVEWGILFSLSNQGRPRFPSEAWVERLAVAAANGHANMQFSAHLCGRYMRDALAGRRTWWDRFEGGTMFDRVQLNFHGQPESPQVRDALWPGDHQYIFQCDGVNDAWVRPLVEEGAGVPLFDRSGGAGVVPDRWPIAWPGAYCGYAGGLGPENLTHEVRRIEDAAGEARVWVDMERKVRSEDDAQFDLARVRYVLGAASIFMIGEA